MAGVGQASPGIYAGVDRLMTTMSTKKTPPLS